jgi:hypothetical protein
MPSDNTTVTSPTTTSVESVDVKTGNLSLDKAAQHLMRLSQQKETEVPAAEPKDLSEVTSEETPPQSEEATSDMVADTATSQESDGTEAVSEPEQTEQEPDDVLSQLSTLDPKAQEIAKALLDKQKERLVGKFEKRIGKEVAKKKTIEGQIQSLSQQLEEFKAQPKTEAAITPPPINNPNNPLAHINDIQSLNQEFIKAKEALRTSEDLLAQMEDNGMDNIDYAGQQFSKQAIKTAMRNAKRVVEDHAPQQAQYLQVRQQNTQTAYDQFPWLKDRNSTEYVLAQKFLSDPTVASRADRDVVVGLLVEGYKAVEARKKTAPVAKPTPKPKAPGSQTEFSASSSPSRASDSEISRSRNSSEIEKLTAKKGGLRSVDAARILLHKENLQKR